MCEHLGPEDSSFRLDPTQREKICRNLRRKYVSLSEADIEDVLSEAQTELVEKLRLNRIESDKPLGGLLFTIAERRGRDMIRRAGSRARTLKRRQEKIRNDAATEGGANAQNAYDPLEFAELQEHVIEALHKLDPDQWLVLSVYCEEYPEVKGPTRLLKALLKQAPEVSKRNWTPATVRGLLNRARAVVRKELRKKGYEL